MATTAEHIMGARGADVATTGRAATVGDVAAQLNERRIGAVVVLEDDGTVCGIVSERDVVRRLATHGAACLDVPVHEAMTGPITTGTPGTTADELMQLMTEGRFRHVPITDDDARLLGIVSIGDVVKSTIEQLQVEKETLTEYVTGSY